MIDVIYKKKFLRRGDIARGTCDRPCNFKIMDDFNFQRYKSGTEYSCHGGFYRVFPARVVIPSDGDWNIVGDCDALSLDFDINSNNLNSELAVSQERNR
jgi:hypothetical protein